MRIQALFFRYPDDTSALTSELSFRNEFSVKDSFAISPNTFTSIFLASYRTFVQYH